MKELHLYWCHRKNGQWLKIVQNAHNLTLHIFFIIKCDCVKQKNMGIANKNGHQMPLE